MSFAQLILLLIAQLATVASNDNHTDAGNNRKLQSDIFEWVQNRTTAFFMPPNIRYDATVFFSAGLYQILGVDEIQGHVEVKLFYTIEYFLSEIGWLDRFPDAPAELLVPGGTFWVPDLLFLNAIKLRSSWGGQSIRDSGAVTAVEDSIVLKYSCSFYMRFFPFDKQVGRQLHFLTSIRDKLLPNYVCKIRLLIRKFWTADEIQWNWNS